MKHALATALLLATLPAEPVDPSTGTRDFLDHCEEAGMALWGHTLCAPVVVVDEGGASALWTSEASPKGAPRTRANTAVEWDGRMWLMLLHPLPVDPAARRALLFHEAFHVHQRALGLPPNAAVAAHLDATAARESIRLEWNALAQALRSEGDTRRAHLRHALAFRAMRLQGDPAAAAAEREQMLHEGLAAYTGIVLSGDPQRLALDALRAEAAKPGFARTFAYASGPAWGLLLDDVRPGWRTGLDTTTDVPDLAPLAPADTPAPAAYDGDAIHAEEAAAAAARHAKLERLLAATDPRHALRLPLAQMQMDFDPGRVTAAPDGATIYEKITLRDAWGSVQVDGAALRIGGDFTEAFVQWPLPDDALQLAFGWRVAVGDDGRPTLVAPDATR